MELPDEVVNLPHGDGPRTEIEYRLPWASSELKKFGLVDNSSRGIWALTLKGKETTNIDPREVERANREADRMRRQTTVELTDTSEEPSIDGVAKTLAKRQHLSKNSSQRCYLVYPPMHSSVSASDCFGSQDLLKSKLQDVQATVALMVMAFYC